MTETNQEVEWQFTAPDLERVARWLQSEVPSRFRVEPGFPRRLVDTYFDTPGWRFYRAGIVCRIRRKGAAAELTLKTMAGPVDGIRTRTELNGALPSGAESDPLGPAGPAGEALRNVAADEPARELFTVHTDRQVYELADDAGVLGEIALDSATVAHPQSDHPLLRVEVEIQDIERARPFVDALVAANSLGPATTSKFGAGLSAAGLSIPALPGFGPTALHGALPASEYALAYLRKQFGELVANDPGTRLGLDPEYLHDMRVATRRIRAAIRAFQPYLPTAVLAVEYEIRWLTRALGDVRDYDVQLQRLAEWRNELPEFSPLVLDPLEELLARQRAEARQAMLASLDSGRYRQLLANFATAIAPHGDEGTAQPAGNAGPTAAVVLPALVRRRYKNVVKRGKNIGPGDEADAYHRLRIQAKKLRYATEFAAPVHGKPARKFVRRMKALQDLLGLHQDASVGRGSLHRLARANAADLPAETLLAMGALIERYREQETSHRHAFPAAFARIRGKPWKRLQQRMASRKAKVSEL